MKKKKKWGRDAALRHSDSLVLICVGDACESELVVDVSRVLAKGVSQRAIYWRVMKREVSACEECFQLFWNQNAHGWQSHRVMLAALVERHRPVSLSLARLGLRTSALPHIHSNDFPPDRLGQGCAAWATDRGRQ